MSRLNRFMALSVGVLWTGLASAKEVAAAADSPTRIVAQVVLKVSNKEQAQAAVVAEAERIGGHFSHLSEARVALRIPVAKTDAYLTHLDTLGLVADRQYRSEDLREQLDDQRTRLNARKKVLAQYFKLLNTADAKAVITVEREITRLVAEVERYEGSIRLLGYDATLANVVVDFQFRDRTQPNQRHQSSFAWLNTLSLAHLVNQGAQVSDVKGTKNKVKVDAPEGFALYDTKRQHWSASPDGVLFRVRTTEHKPQADLPFWSELMAKHLSGAGYKIHEKSDITAGETAGHMLETHAPLGAHDYAYTVVVFPAGSRLVIAEVAGPVERYAQRRESVLAAINGIAF